MSKKIAVLTGAGISTSAGIPDFRGPDGVWTKHPEQTQVYDIEAFLCHEEDRKYSWRWQKESPVWTAQPGTAHKALVKLEQAGMLTLLATQNFDALHEKAGNSSDVIVNLHGTIGTSHCMKCHAKYDTADIMANLDNEPDPHCHRRLPYSGNMPCNGLIKTDVVYFGRGAAGRRARKIVSTRNAGRRTVGHRIHAGSHARGKHRAHSRRGGRADHHYEHGTHAIRSVGRPAYPRRYRRRPAAARRRNHHRRAVSRTVNTFSRTSCSTGTNRWNYTGFGWSLPKSEFFNDKNPNDVTASQAI